MSDDRWRLSSKVHSSKLQNTPASGLWLDGYDVHPDYVIEIATLPELEFRHKGWAVRRGQVWDALKRTGASGGQMQAFAECGSGCWVQHSASRGVFRLSCNCCKSRFCIPCGVARAARLRRSVQSQLDDYERVRFVTLTMRHNRTPLKEQVDRLQRSFKELRRRPFWTNAVRGSAAFLEVKVSARDGLWHVHMHVLCVGTWISKPDLDREWHAVTGDSTVTKVEQARSKNGVAFYVTKYVTKPLDSTVFANTDRLDEAVVALRGRRLCNGSGTLKNMRGDTEPDGVDDWHTIARYDQLVDDARRGDAAAQAILDSLQPRDRALDKEQFVKQQKEMPP